MIYLFLVILFNTLYTQERRKTWTLSSENKKTLSLLYKKQDTLFSDKTTFHEAHEALSKKDLKDVASLIPLLTTEEILRNTKEYGPNLFQRVVLIKQRSQRHQSNVREECKALLDLMRENGIDRNYRDQR